MLIISFFLFDALVYRCAGCSSSSKIKNNRQNEHSECIVEDGGSSEVSTRTGTYIGIRQGCLFNGQMRYWNEYRGIRFAYKPERFERAHPVVNSDKQIDATQYGSQCVQYRSAHGYPPPYFVGDEDCLFLNIMRPDKMTSTLRPVFIFIHGGGLMSGNSSGDVWPSDGTFYDGRYLTLAEDIVYVSINYRLSSFGFINWIGNKKKQLWETTLNGVNEQFEYQQYNGNMGLYDAELAFDWIRRNIRNFGGDPDHITIGGGSSGAGMTAVLTSLASVGPFIKGFVQISGDGFAPTTGFAPPPYWNGNNLHNLETIANDANCDLQNEESMLQCLRNLDAYELLSLSNNKDWRFFIDGEGIDQPYYDLIVNAIEAAFLGGINDGDAVPYAPNWISQPDAGTPESLNELSKMYTTDYGLSEGTQDMVNYAYTDYNGNNRNNDWSIRSNGAHLATDWRYGVGILHKMRIRQELKPNSRNFFFNFNHTGWNPWYDELDLKMAQHTEERLFLFGAPFAFYEKFSDDERDLSRLLMQQFGKFFRSQSVDWEPYPEHGIFDIDGLENVAQEAHSHGANVWLDLVLKENERNNCKSYVQCPYP